MKVKQYVEKMVFNSARHRDLNTGEEVWCILYNLLNDYGIKHCDLVEECSEDLKYFVQSRESEYYNYYPKINTK